MRYNCRSSLAQADKPVNLHASLPVIILLQGIDDGLSDRFGRVRGLHQSLRAHIQVQFPPDGCRSIEQPVSEIDVPLLLDAWCFVPSAHRYSAELHNAVSLRQHKAAAARGARQAIR
jgi:hypothetical protein